MRMVKFAEAKKATKRLLRPARLDNVATKQVTKSMVLGAGRKGLLWQEQGMSVDDMRKKMEVFGEKLKARKKAIAAKNKLYLTNKKIDKTVKASPNVVNTQPKSLNQILLDEGIDVSKMGRAPIKKPIDKVITPKGSGKGLLIGAGVATGAAVLGGLGYGLYRKMRSDKGKKRGSYKNYNFLGKLTNF